jgi:hypothetical protein
MEAGKLIVSAEVAHDRISLYRKSNDFYLLYYQENEVVKTEKVSKRLVQNQFPHLSLN